MRPDQTRPSRFALALGVIAAGLLGWVLLPTPGGSMAAQQSNFMGGSPEVLDSEEVQTLRLRFPAGVRSNWHTHTDGQLLMVEDGIGLHQVRGEPIEARRPGESWWTDSGVEHWHGAHPEEDVVQLTIYSGEVNWMDPVSDEEYTAEPGE